MYIIFFINIINIIIIISFATVRDITISVFLGDEKMGALERSTQPRGAKCWHIKNLA